MLSSVGLGSDEDAAELLELRLRFLLRLEGWGDRPDAGAGGNATVDGGDDSPVVVIDVGDVGERGKGTVVKVTGSLGVVSELAAKFQHGPGPGPDGKVMVMLAGRGPGDELSYVDG